MKKNNTKIMITLILIIASATIIFINKKSYTISDRIKNIEEFKYFDNVKPVGWLKVQGTNIDLPIMDYNSVADISDPTYDIGWTTTSDKSRLVIKSHNMRNVSSHPLIANKNHARFEQLMSFVYIDFAKENQYIQYTYKKKNYLYRIFSIEFTDKDNIQDYIDGNSKEEYINSSIENSIFNYENANVTKKDDIISLVTCTRFFGDTNKNQFVVNARKVRKSERIKRYKIRKTKNYKKIQKVLNSKE